MGFIDSARHTLNGGSVIGGGYPRDQSFTKTLNTPSKTLTTLHFLDLPSESRILIAVGMLRLRSWLRRESLHHQSELKEPSS